ncbi:hypothetical protein B0H11DRAFT_2222456 [Mycena galericulata]|nr:hypothetical protein B0H11DRAFT_2222456 [Mycena galericulata]
MFAVARRVIVLDFGFDSAARVRKFLPRRAHSVRGADTDSSIAQCRSCACCDGNATRESARVKCMAPSTYVEFVRLEVSLGAALVLRSALVASRRDLGWGDARNCGKGTARASVLVPVRVKDIRLEKSKGTDERPVRVDEGLEIFDRRAVVRADQADNAAARELEEPLVRVCAMQLRMMGQTPRMCDEWSGERCGTSWSAVRGTAMEKKPRQLRSAESPPPRTIELWETLRRFCAATGLLGKIDVQDLDAVGATKVLERREYEVSLVPGSGPLRLGVAYEFVDVLDATGHNPTHL